VKSFLDIPRERWVAHNQLAFAIRDTYPVTLGHTLVITRELVETWFAATREQQLAVLELVDVIKQQLDAEHSPAGYNVGFNAGAAAGQTVPHLHVHVIPRYAGDHDDPRGGVRHVIPGRGNYARAAADWSSPPGPGASAEQPQRMTVGEPGRHLGPALAPLFERADEAILVASFVKQSGVREIEHLFDRLLRRGGLLRLVTGDYLEITQADALRGLLDLQRASAAFHRLDDAGERNDDDEEAEADEPVRGRFELRVVKHEDIGRAFHPKAYLFRWGAEPGDGVAYVGSSNLSRSALIEGVEWNLRIERSRDRDGFDEVRAAAEALWQRASTIDEGWLAEYQARARTPELGPGPRRVGEDDEAIATDEDDRAPAPRGAQIEALAALADTRAAGHSRALVVMATGLGKTFLAGFDVEQLASAVGRELRVLIVAHRRELLIQAQASFRRLFPLASFSWCAGASAELDGQIVLASIQKLARMDVSQIGPEHFDYIIVDEVHHASAPSYRALFEQLRPRFLLGLTATPERADDDDIAGLFHDNLAFTADLGRGIADGDLVPFAYEGLKDPVDYAPIPWRNAKFDTEALASAVQTQARMDTLWSAWERLAGTRTLVFCVTIAHARFVTEWLADKGVRIVCVHSGADSHDRQAALRKLEAGEIDAITTVDLFNEGIDCKPIDRVVMLRPTASPVVFLQQLGRGLRTAADAGKQRLQVIDFVGNHHVFLNRLRMLLSLAGDRRVDVQRFVRSGGQAPVALPDGCSVQVELEAIELLAKLLPSSSDNALVHGYRELRASRGQRPSAGELFRRGLNPASVCKPGCSSWFEFVADEGDLREVEAELLAEAKVRAWLAELQQPNSIDPILLDVLLARDALATGMPLAELVERCPEHLVDPIAALTKGRSPWFEVEDDRLVSRVPVPEEAPARATFVAMTRELVDWRLARYRRGLDERATVEDSGEVASFTMKVVHNSRGPILWFLSGSDRAQLPTGETDVRLPDGSIWQFNLVKIACNVARPVSSSRNALPDLLRRWFGPDAGKPGSDFRVEFRRAPEGWWVEPLGAKVITLTRRDQVIAYPSLRAAAGALAGDPALQGGEVEASAVRLPVERSGDDLFAVRATGDSMAGGARPIRDGDWVVLEWARQRGLGSVIGRIALVAVGDPSEDRQWLIKRFVQTDAGVLLRSENPAHPDLAAGTEVEVVALLREVVQPEQLGPAVGARIADGELGDAFGLSEPPRAGVSRIDGHLFVLLDEPGAVVGVDRVRVSVKDRGPGETAFVLTRVDGGWRYAGVGRWCGDEGLWAIPAVDYASSKSLGDGSVSRRLDPVWLERAREFVGTLEVGAWIDARGRRCRVVQVLSSGAVRIDGGPEGFKPRNVSLSDLGWVLLARDVAGRNGAVLDEAFVNRVRYVDGTPKKATRWIDTGWATVLVAASDFSTDGQ
jgi:superfamily II DNA or RNA helicase/diadenosine tetraphosphate (Ap4A) HIT family hydrolase/HKD family nuclease/SOS-response transcriptional repressor LexA